MTNDRLLYRVATCFLKDLLPYVAQSVFGKVIRDSQPNLRYLVDCHEVKLFFESQQETTA